MMNSQYFKKLIADKDALLPESNEWHFILNDRMQIVTASQAIREVVEIGGVQSQTCDLNLFELVHPSDHELLIKQIYRVLNRESAYTEFDIKFGCENKSRDCSLKLKYIEGSGSESVMGTIIPLSQCKKRDDGNGPFVDALTGVYTRAYFNYQIAMRTKMINENDAFAIAIVDINKFNQINDEFGFQVGDLLLKEFFRVVQLCVPGNGIIARNSGDQALVLIEGEGCTELLQDCLNALVMSLRNEIVIEDHKISLDVSIGSVSFPDSVNKIEALIPSAEYALKSAKHEGGTTIHHFDKCEYHAFERKNEIYHALNTAIESSEFYLKFQPLYDTRLKKVCGVETLIRWKSLSFGDIPPSVFIPLAEQSDLIIDIGNWVLNETLSEIGYLDGILDEEFIFSINVSPVQMASDRFHYELEEMIRDSGIDFSRIQIELTESVFVNDFASSYKKLEYLKKLGIRIAMDDFGTGYSSLNYIRRLPLDVIKIDKLFTSQIAQTDIDKAIAKAIIDLAASVSIDVIAEGIETEDQMLQLMKLGCHKIQGYYIAKPLTITELEELITLESTWKEIIDIQ